MGSRCYHNRRPEYMARSPCEFAKYVMCFIGPSHFISFLLIEDYDHVGASYGRLFLWTTPRLYWPFRLLVTSLNYKYQESVAGPFDGCIPVSDVVQVTVSIGT